MYTIKCRSCVNCYYNLYMYCILLKSYINRVRVRYRQKSTPCGKLTTQSFVCCKLSPCDTSTVRNIRGKVYVCCSASVYQSAVPGSFNLCIPVIRSKIPIDPHILDLHSPCALSYTFFVFLKVCIKAITNPFRKAACNV